MILERFWKKVLRRKGLSWLLLPAALFWFLSLFYRVGVWFAMRNKRVTVQVDIPVLSVGNITVGGTGKTPMVSFLARYLINDGYRVGVVSSGWGRANRVSFVEPGYRGQNMATDNTGDEVRLLACQLPEAVFSVAPDKSVAAQNLAAGGKVDLAIVDDGYQHTQLHRDLNLVTYDAAVPRRMLRPFPAGVLREPFSALKRADVIVITRSNFARDITRLQKRLKRVHACAHHYHARFSITELVGVDRRWPVKYLEDKSVVLFAGVGNFKPLRKQVAALSATLACTIELSDHQTYTEDVLQRIREAAKKHEPDVLVTTFKDWVKLSTFDFGPEVYYLAQSIDLDPGEEKLIQQIRTKLKLVRRSD